MNTSSLGDYGCLCTAIKGASGILYVLTSEEIDIGRAHAWAVSHNSNVVVIKCPGLGDASAMPEDAKALLESEVMPAVEHALGYRLHPLRKFMSYMPIEETVDQ